ncbi:HAMP domain-containing sensor histidine kinase [Plantactinospora sp. B6F1]|uniref:ATP-binding protein n=1 Tax=Plantactinospora sp. B6F1 TaxID=3158971 RepID=UPI00102BFF05
MVIDQHEPEGRGFGHGAAFPALRPIMPGQPETAHSAGIRARPGDQALLLRMFCHELRSPIESLRSLTRALAEDSAALRPDERRAMAALAREQATHLAGLWRQAVATTQSLAEPVDQPVPLRQVLPVAVAAGAPQRLTVRLTRGAGGRLVHADRVRQILRNLVENALRHGPAEGRVRVCASVRAGALVLVVTDEGRSCEPLLAALRRTAPPPGVSGLGLWIVRHLVAAEGGTITAYRAAHGVAVRVSLPPRRRRPGDADALAC